MYRSLKFQPVGSSGCYLVLNDHGILAIGERDCKLNERKRPSWIFSRCHIVLWSQLLILLGFFFGNHKSWHIMAVSASPSIKPLFHDPWGMALATISLAAHRGTTTRRAMRSGDVGEKGAEAGMVSEDAHLVCTANYDVAVTVKSQRDGILGDSCSTKIAGNVDSCSCYLNSIFFVFRHHSCKAFFPEGDTEESAKSQIPVTTEPPMRIGHF